MPDIGGIAGGEFCYLMNIVVCEVEGHARADKGMRQLRQVVV